jgi:hypothetical protein
MMTWFGKRYPAPAYQDTPQTETPVGTACRYCDEKIVMGDDGWILMDGSVFHRECHMRSIIGSVAHQQQRCSCFGGLDRDHEDGLTRRQSAIAAQEYFETNGLRYKD